MIHAQIEFHNVDISAAAARADIGAGSGGVLPARAMRHFSRKNQNFELDNSPFVWYNAYRGRKPLHHTLRMTAGRT